jgi:hypothetical protein
VLNETLSPEQASHHIDSAQEEDYVQFSPVQEASVRLRAAAPPEAEIPLRLKSDPVSDNPFVSKDDFEERR